ncbi:FecR family protein [Carboxydochorda subterranea]|uniref:FecR family protein n=1 Tax=Carboxydichorda subterranea TaxID=3109565 RepID=A0ABZ1BU22_9FIRM|nr:FecR family protein [Limnochorda sp. L945t]WRP16125.1 FecR family protein [Limnochorda sp. L945t]
MARASKPLRPERAAVTAPVRRAGWVAALLAATIAAWGWAALLGPSPLPADAASPPPVSVRVVQVSGDVAWRAGGAPDGWRPLLRGQALAAGDWIRTGTSGRVELVYAGGPPLSVALAQPPARLWVEPGTLLQVGAGYRSLSPEELRELARQTVRPEGAFGAAYLKIGSLWAEVSAAFGRIWRFEVETPTAVAGVRGTLFRLQVLPDGTTRLFVHSGAVELRSLRYRWTVREREAAAIRGDTGELQHGQTGTPPGPRTADEWSLDRFIEESLGHMPQERAASPQAGPGQPGPGDDGASSGGKQQGPAEPTQDDSNQGGQSQKGPKPSPKGGPAG